MSSFKVINPRGILQFVVNQQSFNTILPLSTSSRFHFITSFSEQSQFTMQFLKIALVAVAATLASAAPTPGKELKARQCGSGGVPW